MQAERRGDDNDDQRLREERREFLERAADKDGGAAHGGCKEALEAAREQFLGERPAALHGGEEDQHRHHAGDEPLQRGAALPLGAGHAGEQRYEQAEIEQRLNDAEQDVVPAAQRRADFAAEAEGGVGDEHHGGAPFRRPRRHRGASGR